MTVPPGLRQIYNDTAPELVIQKGAQAWISELLINTAFWAADTGLGGRGHVLYVLPSDRVMHDFTDARFAKAVQESPYLQSRVRHATRGPQRQGLLQVGDGLIYRRTAGSPQHLTGVDADEVILDDFSFMDAGVLPLARQRLGSSRDGRLRLASTPLEAGRGIHDLFLESDQHYYYLPCPACNLAQRLTWEENVDLEAARLVCRRCRAELDVWAAGEWRPQAPGNRLRGYHWSRLYAPTLDLEATIRESLETGLLARRAFATQVLGEVYEASGYRLDVARLNANRQPYDLADYDGEPCHAGVDSGDVLHVVIRAAGGDHRLWWAGAVPSYEQLDAVFADFNIEYCVLDPQSTRQAARAFAERHSPRVGFVYYTMATPGWSWKASEPETVTAHRTDLLDTIADQLLAGELPMPRDAQTLGVPLLDGLGSYYRQLLTPVRTSADDQFDKPLPRWERRGRDDHFFHAEGYRWLAGTQKPGGLIMMPRLI